MYLLYWYVYGLWLRRYILLTLLYSIVEREDTRIVELIVGTTRIQNMSTILSLIKKQKIKKVKLFLNLYRG